VTLVPQHGLYLFFCRSDYLYFDPHTVAHLFYPIEGAKLMATAYAAELLEIHQLVYQRHNAGDIIQYPTQKSQSVAAM